MPHMPMRDFVLKVAQSLDWVIMPRGVTKKICGSNENMGCVVEDLIRLLQEHEDYGKRSHESIIKDCLLLIEGSFVLMSLGYQIYKEN